MREAGLADVRLKHTCLWRGRGVEFSEEKAPLAVITASKLCSARSRYTLSPQGRPRGPSAGSIFTVLMWSR